MHIEACVSKYAYVSLAQIHPCSWASRDSRPQPILEAIPQHGGPVCAAFKNDVPEYL